MFKSYRYRIFPTVDQAIMLNEFIGCARYVYNFGLTKKIETYQNTGKRIGKFEIAKLLPELKNNPETEWLKRANAQSLQMALERVDKAFIRFFKEKKGFPKFKSKKNSSQSYSMPQGVHIDWKNSKIMLPKLKMVNISLCRNFTGNIKLTTVLKTTSNKYFVILAVDDGKPLPAKKKCEIQSAIAIDLGLKDFATLSSGEKIANPRFFKKGQSKLAALQRKYCKKIKGSNNQEKLRLKISKQHEYIKNSRKDFLHKVSSKIVYDNQVNTICLEDLNVEGLLKNKRLSKSIFDVGWGGFIKMVTYKTEWAGKNLLTIGRFEPSSKMCSCGIINKNLSLNDRFWTCLSCKTTHDRDILAANNILKFAFYNINKNTGLEPGI